MQQLHHVLACLKERNEPKLAFGGAMPGFSEAGFSKCGWRGCYPGAKEVLPPGAPEARGKHVAISCFAGAGHAGCKEARRPRAGIAAFASRPPAMWLSKRQSIAEAPTFGSEAAALEAAAEAAEGLRHKGWWVLQLAAGAACFVAASQLLRMFQGLRVL